MKAKIMELLEKISKKLEKFTPPVQPNRPQSEEELGAYIDALKVCRDSLKAVQEINKAFIKLNKLLAEPMSHADLNVAMFYHQANALRTLFSLKMNEAQMAKAVKQIDDEIEGAEGYRQQYEEDKKDQG